MRPLRIIAKFVRREVKENFFLNQDGGYIPLKLLSRGQLKFSVKPWITPGIKKSIQIKNRYHRKFLKTKSIYFQNRFKLYKNKLNHLLKPTKNTTIMYTLLKILYHKWQKHMKRNKANC